MKIRFKERLKSTQDEATPSSGEDEEAKMQGDQKLGEGVAVETCQH